MFPFINWQCKHFNQLSADELYSILQLRSEIFVVEQQCIFQDMDGLDKVSYHVMGYHENILIAHTRLLPSSATYKEQSIGRVVVKKIARASGIGRQLMAFSAENSYALFGRNPIKIGAQLYLKKFYQSLGYEPCSDVYDEDGIEHIHMLKQP